MQRFKYLLASLAVVATLGIAVVATACDDDGTPAATGSSTASQGAVDDLTARVQRNEMLYAVVTIGTLGLHEMDEQLNDTGVIDPAYSRNTRTAVRLLALTNWDSAVKADADAVHGHAVDLLKALADEDVEAAAAAAHELHESEHEFSDKVWAIVAKDLPADAGGVEEEHEEPAEGEGTETHDEGSEEGEASPEATP